MEYFGLGGLFEGNPAIVNHKGRSKPSRRAVSPKKTVCPYPTKEEFFGKSPRKCPLVGGGGAYMLVLKLKSQNHEGEHVYIYTYNLAKLSYFTNLDFPEIRGPISLP